MILRLDTAEAVFEHNPQMIRAEKLCPGSIAKVWSAAVVLESGNDTPYRCGGTFPVPDSVMVDNAALQRYNFRRDGSRIFLKCSLRDGHGTVSLADALSRSCNAYFLNAAASDPDTFLASLESLWLFPRHEGRRWQKLIAVIGEGDLMVMPPADVAIRFAALWSAQPVLSYHGAGEPFRVLGPLRISNETRNRLLAAMRRAVADGTLKTLAAPRTVTLLGGKTGTGTRPGAKFATSGWNVLYFSFQRVNYLLLTVSERGSGRGSALDLSSAILRSVGGAQ